MQLSEIQERFKRTMFAADQAADMESVFEAGQIPLDNRLGIYRNNIIGSLSTVISETFPLVKTLVGEEFMAGMAEHFILAQPPHGGCLNEYGGGFPDFIANFRPAKTLAYLPDVARLEWAVQSAYYAQDDRALTAEQLAEIPPEALGEMTLRLRDGVKLVASPHPLSAIRDFCADPDGKLDLDQGGVKLLIHRPYLNVETLEIDDASFEMLNTLNNHVSLGEALETTINAYPDFDVQGFLQTHLGLETFLALNANI